MKQYKITIRDTDISMIYSGNDPEDAFCNMFRARVREWDKYSRDMMLHYMDAYHIVEIAA